MESVIFVLEISSAKWNYESQNPLTATAITVAVRRNVVSEVVIKHSKYTSERWSSQKARVLLNRSEVQNRKHSRFCLIYCKVPPQLPSVVVAATAQGCEGGSKKTRVETPRSPSPFREAFQGCEAPHREGCFVGSYLGNWKIRVADGIRKDGESDHRLSLSYRCL
ncbi:hypothetical protein CEXT_653251 [Caerostris extrusa]|uniref:Uncharacterized protein n=1 Tax=Caerostris extrusa TaxID=172846 RepID=A0AAV4W9Y9_CAEEX|nr:hypothetical protein CEXT_653251 [Caerostris extrusa]